LVQVWFGLRIFGSFFEYFQSLKLGRLWKLHGKILDLRAVETENMKGIISRQITDIPLPLQGAPGLAH